MRVLHVHHALYLPVVYVRELRRRGVHADALYFGGAELAWLVGHPDRRLPALSYYPDRALLRLLAFFFRTAPEYDVVHFHSQPGFFHFGCLFGRFLRRLGMPDLRLLRRRGTRIVYSHWGCNEGRLRSNFAKESGGEACRNCATGQFSTYCSDAAIAAVGEVQERLGDVILVHEPDFADYNRTARYHPAIVDFETFSPDRPVPPAQRRTLPDDVFAIYHAPGQRQRRGNERGTLVIEAVVEGLRAEGCRIALLTTDGLLDYSSVGFLQRQGDLAIDNLYYGWYGNMVRECMAQGVPVATRVAAAPLARHLSWFPTAPPLIDVNEANLREVITHAYRHREELREIGRRQRDFVREAHDTDAVIARLLAAYRG